VIQKDDQQVYRSSLLQHFDWLEHGFGTRLSDGWYPAERLATVKQIHSAQVIRAMGEPRTLGQGDAIVSNEPGLLAGIKTADCLPLLIADQRRHAVAAVHAGWRGTVQEIARHTVEKMREQFGTDPRDLWVAIGPGIGECCYEVGREVLAGLQPFFPEKRMSSGGGELTQIAAAEKAFVDLREANRRQLLAAGVPASQIDADAPCTHCTPEELHSYRRDKEAAGRLISLIGLRAS
jgi:YfiH family protein